MKKLTILLSAALFAGVASAASPAATQQWVRHFTATNGAASMISEDSYSNGVMRVTAVDGTNSVTITVEDWSVYALRATNVAASVTSVYGITNGYTFVWRGETTTNGIFKTGGETIYATRTNYLWRGIGSTNVSSRCWFADNFAVYGIKIQPSYAAQFPED